MFVQIRHGSLHTYGLLEIKRYAKYYSFSLLNTVQLAFYTVETVFQS